MQSQQKRLKWSRGETAEALEERTDTGITQASVEFMENCIPDIYGNISRRPALDLVPCNVAPRYNWTWSEPAPQLGSHSWNDITFDGNNFVAIGEGGWLGVSADGETWSVSENSSLGSHYWQAITYGDGKYVAVGYHTRGYASVSTDGINWSDGTESNIYYGYWEGVAYGNGMFVALDTSGYISISYDGSSWEPRIDNTNLHVVSGSHWYSIAFGNGVFVALNRNGYVGISTDGINWSVIKAFTKQSDTMMWDALCYNGAEFVALDLYTGDMAFSTNGIQWIIQKNVTRAPDVFAYGNDIYVGIWYNGYYSIASQTQLISPKMRMGFTYNKYLKVFPFYITENDYILCGFSPETTQFIRIKDLQIVGYNETDPLPGYVSSNDVSFVQQNNYAIIGTDGQTYMLTMTLNGNGLDFTPVLQTWLFTAGWYAPFGTKTKTVSSSTITGLKFNDGGAGFKSYIKTEDDGSSTVYSYIFTGLPSGNQTLPEAIPAGSIITFPNNGAYFRVEGYETVSSKQIVFGSLLTAVADNSATDTQVSVEYGFVSLTPATVSVSEYSFPRPTKFTFSDQRLWAGGWIIDDTVQYSLVVGSQIARYSDLKNDYNMANEAITLDIFTKYKEQVLHLIDYNGLKIFTNSHEYAYVNGGAKKQSANGSWPTCEPIVFESLCLYVDSTGNQVRAMQYELQSNIYDSSCINQIAPHDLVWKPIGLAHYEDKVNSTGKYLFVSNLNSENHPKLAVCNFVPSNQANIWSRWSMPTINVDDADIPLIHSVVNMKGEPIFLLITKEYTSADSTLTTFVKPAILDFNGLADVIGIVQNNKFIIGSYTYINADDEQIVNYITLPNTLVNVYADGIFKWQDTTDSTGALTKDTSGLINITIGLPINSTIRSHPLDVGGKTKSEKKRIGKSQMSVHETEPGAITLNGKTGYMNPEHDHICFYGVSGMKDEVKYVITNNNGAMFHLESLLMNIEYGTLDS